MGDVGKAAHPLGFAGVRGSSIDPVAVRGAFAAGGATLVQCISPRCVFGARHLLAAHDHVERRRRAGTLRTRDDAMELLLCITCTDQIEVALDRGGVVPGAEFAVVAWEGDVDADAILAKHGLARDDSLLAPKGKSLALLGMARPAPGDPGDWAVELVNLTQL